MILEALKFVHGKMSDAAKREHHVGWTFKPVDVPGDQPGNLRYVDRDGQLATMDVASDVRFVTVDDVDALAYFLNTFVDEAADDVEIYVGDFLIECKFRGIQRHDHVGCKLEYMPAFESLQKIRATGSASFDQKGFLRWLKATLGGEMAGGDVLALSQQCASIRFQSTENGHSDITSGGADVGKSVVKKLNGMADAGLPEVFNVRSLVYVNQPGDLVSSVKCHLDVDVDTHRFTVTVCPASFLAATQEAKAEVCVFLSQHVESPIPIFHGRLEQ